MFNNAYLLVFAVAFMGCVLAIPVVTRVASWAGAIDRPDKFRRIHKGAIPRLGGLGLGVGLLLALIPAVAGGYIADWASPGDWWQDQWAVMVAGITVLLVGVLDDTRGMNPRPKLMGQAFAVMVLILGGIRITQFSVLGFHMSLAPEAELAVLKEARYFYPLFGLSTLITMIWFLGCMNIWNLIDGMDGLASGVGLLVSGTLMLVALKQGNDVASAALAAALAGSLAGFLLYNWHPACIFLGDSGSLLIGMLIGVIGVQSSMKGTATVSILFPILAMGLPISDTAMAIFRRWVRNLPLSSADRRHIHHLLIGLGLNPRQAALLLYCFSGFLCGVVLLGVALNNPVHGEFLALLLGGTGCLAFLLILTSRRDELALLRGDLQSRFSRKRQERMAAKTTWESIQRIELCESHEAIWDVLRSASESLGCDYLQVRCDLEGREILSKSSHATELDSPLTATSGSVATLRLKSGEDLRLTTTLHQSADSPLEADIAFRALQRLALATAQRLDRLHALAHGSPELDATDAALGTYPGRISHDRSEEAQGPGPEANQAVTTSTDLTRNPIGWLRRAFSLGA